MNKETYRKIFDWQAKFYRNRPWAAKTLRIVNYVLTLAIFCAYVGLLTVRFVRKEWLELGWAVAIVLGCFCAVWLLREKFNRKRPYDPLGAGIEPIFRKIHSSDKSFPSRHLAMAFAIGGATLPVSLVGGIAVYVAGVLLGYIRFAAGLHYPTDLLAGVAVGGVFGALVFAL